MQCMSKREGIRKFSSYPAINLIIFLLVYLLCLSFFPPMGICMSASLPDLLAFCLPDCMSFGLFECLVVWLCLSVSDSLSVCMLSVHLPAFCQSIFLSSCLTVFLTDCLSVCLSVRANAWIASFETLYGGQFMLLSQLIIPNYLVLLSHWCNTSFL